MVNHCFLKIALPFTVSYKSTASCKQRVNVTSSMVSEQNVVNLLWYTLWRCGEMLKETYCAHTFCCNLLVWFSKQLTQLLVYKSKPESNHCFSFYKQLLFRSVASILSDSMLSLHTECCYEWAEEGAGFRIQDMDNRKQTVTREIGKTVASRQEPMTSFRHERAYFCVTIVLFFTFFVMYDWGICVTPSPRSAVLSCVLPCSD